MRIHLELRRFALLALAAFPLSHTIHAQETSEANSPTVSRMAPYPNNSKGLRQLLNNMLAAAKSEDKSELLSMIRETEIPNYERWFTSNFGQEKGESWARPYGRWLAKNEQEFQELLVKLRTWMASSR